ncbi:hypothetical protein NHP21005_01790 [Helicobacter sp. NHP21005]|nr:hypothetical protein NHP21005_01790 [Helicobacter sp. NHP21005]
MLKYPFIFYEGEMAVKKTLVWCALACSGVEGLEFGEMGNTSFGMGGGRTLKTPLGGCITTPPC